MVLGVARAAEDRPRFDRIGQQQDERDLRFTDLDDGILHHIYKDKSAYIRDNKQAILKGMRQKRGRGEGDDVPL